MWGEPEKSRGGENLPGAMRETSGGQGGAQEPAGRHVDGSPYSLALGRARLQLLCPVVSDLLEQRLKCKITVVCRY